MKTETVVIPAYGDNAVGDAFVDISVQCLTCKHLFDNTICKAFSKGIPIEILSGKFDHRKPFKGDNGIQFEERL